MEEWKRSSYCEGGHCVEVRAVPGLLVIRSSIWPDQHILVSPDEWEAFVAGIKNLEFDSLLP